jgi:LPXTG-motif cell wall-anchored protein
VQIDDVTGLAPGDSVSPPLKFTYTGPAAPEGGLILRFDASSPHLRTTADYANCGEGFCAIDLAPEPGTVYELAADTPLTTTLAADAPGPMTYQNHFTVGALDTAAADRLDFNDADTALAFTESDTASIESHPTMLVTSTDHPFDVQVLDHTVTGAPGTEFTYDIAYANLGPADALAYEHPDDLARHFMVAVQLPDGLEVVHQGEGVPPGWFDIDHDNYCAILPDAPIPPPDPDVYGLERVDLLCRAPGSVDVGETMTLPIDFRITDDAVSADGAIAILEQSRTWTEIPPPGLGEPLPDYPPLEGELGNNIAAFDLEAPVSGRLPDTGGSVAAVGLAGAGALAAGGILLVALRRRALARS